MGVNMAQNGTNGLKTAADLILASMGQGAPAPEPEQIDIEDVLGLPQRAVDTTGEASPRARGRPPGARNRRTVEWCEYLLARYTSPLEVLAQISVARVADLMRDLQCNALEALQEKRHAAIALAPFLHSRQPLAVQISERKLIYLTINASGADGAPIADGESVTIEARDIEAPAPATDGASVATDDASD